MNITLITATTTYIFPELRNPVAISTELVTCENVCTDRKIINIKKVIFFIVTILFLMAITRRVCFEFLLIF